MHSRSTSGGLFRSAVAALVLAACALPAWSQLRTIPPTGKRAVLSDYENPFLVLGGERKRLAPGAVIFDTNNRMILPGYLPDKADVVYTTDQGGQVMRVYILTPHEIQRLDAARR